MTQSAPAGRPNVLLVVLDAARRDALTPYGAPPGATPVLAALAERGSALPRAYATASWTLPSHTSMFTGQLPRALGLSQPPDGTAAGARQVLSGLSERLLPAVLGRAGYARLGFSANVWASAHAGFDTGFDEFTYVASERVERNNALLSGGWRARLAWMLEGLRSRGDDGAAALGTALRDAIAAWSGTPTFWFVNLVEGHSPYLPPRPWNDLAPVGRVRAALDAQRYMGFESICVQATGQGTIPAASLARMHHLHERSVSYMDAWLGEVFGALDARGILENTLVIVTADHGESFGEDGLVAHGFSLAEQLMHVPLVMAGPGAVASDEVFSLARLASLIADAAGVPHPYLARDLPDGAAVGVYDPMAGPSDPRIVAFAAKYGIGPEGVRRLCASITAATDGRYKLVRDELGMERGFDLETDPLEQSVVAPPDEALSRLRRAIEEGERVGAPAPSPAPAASPEELAQLEAQMKLLGYM